MPRSLKATPPMVGVNALIAVVREYVLPQVRAELGERLDEQIKGSIQTLVAEEVHRQVSEMFAAFVYDEATKDD